MGRGVVWRKTFEQFRIFVRSVCVRSFVRRLGCRLRNLTVCTLPILDRLVPIKESETVEYSPKGRLYRVGNV